jgi:hypothetical protein
MLARQRARRAEQEEDFDEHGGEEEMAIPTDEEYGRGEIKRMRREYAAAMAGGGSSGITSHHITYHTIPYHHRFWMSTN